MPKGVLGYGRYLDDPDHVGCPRAQSDMTPCIARDGQLALADDQRCVGCNGVPFVLLAELRRELTGRNDAMIASPEEAAKNLAAEVREATKGLVG